MGTWNEDVLAKLGSQGAGATDPNATQNAAALQAIKDSNAAVQTSNAAVKTATEGTLAAVQARLQTAAGTPTVSAKTLAAATAQTVLAANANRLGAVFQNDTGQTVLLQFGTTASPTSYSTKILNGGYYELPYRYVGAVSAYSTAASAAPHLLVTELVA